MYRYTSIVVVVFEFPSLFFFKNENQANMIQNYDKYWELNTVHG